MKVSDLQQLLQERGLSRIGRKEQLVERLRLATAAAGEMARRAEARRLVLVHGYPDVDKDAAVAEAQAVFGGPVEWAREGQPVHA
jgi:ribonuclease BN (tRNA processing enzyme)